MPLKTLINVTFFFFLFVQGCRVRSGQVSQSVSQSGKKIGEQDEEGKNGKE